jgi:two-component sensor histidine kinase
MVYPFPQDPNRSTQKEKAIVTGQYKILVVDDNQDLTENIRDILSGNGYAVSMAFDGSSAIELSRKERFDLMIADYRLPDMDGLQLQERISAFTDADVIIITGHASLASAVEAVYRKRIVGYETKPLDMDRLLAFIRQIIERRRLDFLHKQAEEHLKDSLKEKETLLREIHHRVKNNLAAISSLIQLQSYQTKDPYALSLLTDLNNRVMSMTFVHEELYKSENLAKIDFGAYLNRLVSGIYQSFACSPVNIRIDADHIFLDMEKAIPCGLMAAELVTNAFKYAFPVDALSPDHALGKGQGEGVQPEIHIEIKREDDLYTLIISDNGVGLPHDFDLQKSSTLGMMLIQTWAKHQLGGTLDVSRGPGARFTMTFKEKRY